MTHSLPRSACPAVGLVGRVARSARGVEVRLFLPTLPLAVSRNGGRLFEFEDEQACLQRGEVWAQAPGAGRERRHPGVGGRGGGTLSGPSLQTTGTPEAVSGEVSPAQKQPGEDGTFRKAQRAVVLDCPCCSPPPAPAPSLSRPEGGHPRPCQRPRVGDTLRGRGGADSVSPGPRRGTGTPLGDRLRTKPPWEGCPRHDRSSETRAPRDARRQPGACCCPSGHQPTRWAALTSWGSILSPQVTVLNGQIWEGAPAQTHGAGVALIWCGGSVTTVARPGFLDLRLPWLSPTVASGGAHVPDLSGDRGCPHGRRGGRPCRGALAWRCDDLAEGHSGQLGWGRTCSLRGPPRSHPGASTPPRVAVPPPSTPAVGAESRGLVDPQQEPRQVRRLPLALHCP